MHFEKNMFIWIEKAHMDDFLQCNAMQCNAMQCNAMQCNAMWKIPIQYNTKVALLIRPIAHLELHALSDVTGDLVDIPHAGSAQLGYSLFLRHVLDPLLLFVLNDLLVLSFMWKEKKQSVRQAIPSLNAPRIKGTHLNAWQMPPFNSDKP